MVLIRDEHARTRAMLETVYGTALSSARPRLSRVLERRREALTLLHRLQVTLLRRRRARLAEGEKGLSENLLLEVLVPVNASGLGAMGLGFRLALPDSCTCASVTTTASHTDPFCIFGLPLSTRLSQSCLTSGSARSNLSSLATWVRSSLKCPEDLVPCSGHSPWWH